MTVPENPGWTAPTSTAPPSTAAPSTAPPSTGPSLAAAFARVVRADPLRVAETAASLHRPVHDEDGLADLLDRAVRAAVQWLPEVDFAGISVQFDRAPFTAAGTDPVVLAVDALQAELGDGPCLAAMRTGTIVAADAAEVAARWPELAPRARALGVASFLSTPLLVSGTSRGSLTLFGRGADGFRSPQADVVAVLAEYVGRGLADYAALRTAALQSAHLREALDGRAPIEQAKGILMAVHQITADAAFELLRVRSQHTNTKLRDVAAAFVAEQARRSATDGPPGPAPARPAGSAGHDFESAFDHAPIGMAIADPAGVLLTANPALARLLGATPQSLAGTTLLEATHPADVEDAREAWAELGDGTRPTSTQVLRLRSASGEWVRVNVSTATVLGGDGAAAHLVVAVEDVTTHHVLAETLRQQALHDPLTGLPHRTLLVERLHHGRDRERADGTTVSLLFCDVDDFKTVNDTHGHPAGDSVLVAVADRLRACLRPTDTAARVGGDEFAVLCEDTGPAAAAAVAQRLATALAAPVDVGGTPVVVAVSVGVASATAGPGWDPDALWQAADAAMYAGKARRRDAAVRASGSR